MIQYHNLLNRILTTGELKEAARAGMPNTIALFGELQRYPLQDGFPLLTTKKVPFKLVLTELLWFLRGDTNVDFLLKHNNNIWLDDAYRGYCNKRAKDIPLLAHGEALQLISKEQYKETVLNDPNFADDYGDLGQTYGHNWRSWNGEIDQVLNVIHSLKAQPFGRRNIVSSWNASETDKLTLPPCHPLFQFNCRKGVEKAFKLDLIFTMRSVDVMLGLPFNLSSYALLCHIVAVILDYEVGDLIASLNDCHVYDDQLPMAKELLTRDPNKYSLPKLKLSGPFENIKDYWGVNYFHLDAFLADIELNLDCIKIEDYESYPTLKVPLSVGV